LKQGDTLSSGLFNFASEHAIKRVRVNLLEAYILQRQTQTLYYLQVRRLD